MAEQCLIRKMKLGMDREGGRKDGELFVRFYFFQITDQGISRSQPFYFSL